MNKEGDRYVVNDIVMVSGKETSQRIGLKQTLRQLVVGGTQIGSTQPRQAKRRDEDMIDQDEPESGAIVPASYTTDSISDSEDELMRR